MRWEYEYHNSFLFSILGYIFTTRHLETFYFSQKMGTNMPCKMCSEVTICMICQSPLFLRKIRNQFPEIRSEKEFNVKNLRPLDISENGFHLKGKTLLPCKFFPLKADPLLPLKVQK